MRNEERLTQIAFALAVDVANNERKKFYHVTLGLHKKRIVIVGVNRNKTSPVAKQLGYASELIHSELSALLNLQRVKFDREDIDLINFCFARRYVLRGIVRPRNSKPCRHCATFVGDFASITYYVAKEGWIKIPKK